MAWLPSSVLFCCDHNAVRSPMAEGLLKKLHGARIYVQSAGVKHDMEVDGFAVSVCSEIDVALEKHRARSFLEMQAWGEPIEAFEKIVALSPASQRAALEYTRWFSIDVEYWPTLDPTGLGETRERKLDAYRQTRDQLLERMKAAFPAF
ncbi:MAG: low molecular weight phosphatase family protein [Pseudomonadota bacterium]